MMGTMNYGHKIISFVLRGLEFIGSIVILGLLAKFFQLVDDFDGPTNQRLIYAISMASISIAASVILMPPLNYSFHAFPLDVALFALWIVCFALLEDLSGTHTCSSTWFETYWGRYWDPDAGRKTLAGSSSACSRWRVILAFSFIIGFCFLISALLGFYICVIHHDMGAHFTSWVDKRTSRGKPKGPDVEKHAPQAEDEQRLPAVPVAQNGA